MLNRVVGKMNIKKFAAYMDRLRRTRFFVLASYIVGGCAAGAIALILQDALGLSIDIEVTALHYFVAAVGIAFVYYVHRWKT